MSTPLTWDEVEACRHTSQLVFTADDVLLQTGLARNCGAWTGPMVATGAAADTRHSSLPRCSPRSGSWLLRHTAQRSRGAAFAAAIRYPAWSCTSTTPPRRLDVRIGRRSGRAPRGRRRSRPPRHRRRAPPAQPATSVGRISRPAATRRGIRERWGRAPDRDR
ncbi:hypothetical protein [Amycolatopsis sp. Hca4]|uniref:hypothetical protein n=1 Tax=Amycolatopsis sp. Hca4 TaxID=2742131 RepID=UPI0034CE2EF4